jgi:hypothetical protein
VVSIISRTGGAIWPKLTFGLLATITHDVVSFCAYALSPTLLPIFKSFLEVVFCEGVQHHLPRSPQLCQNGDLSILSSIEKTEKSTEGGE